MARQRNWTAHIVLAIGLLLLFLLANATRPKCSELRGSDNADGALYAQCK